eukprot:5654938-Pleurochrysis_carterae.AAC.1
MRRWRAWSESVREVEDKCSKAWERVRDGQERETGETARAHQLGAYVQARACFDSARSTGLNARKCTAAFPMMRHGQS